jgi:diacylglycerol kinase family enzyme
LTGWLRVDARARPVLFVNPRSGGGKASRTGLVEHARAFGIRCVELQPGQDVGALARHAVAEGTDALGMAGGDGSLAPVATVASAEGLPFACVPVGTRNHFAADLGIVRRDPVGALGAFIDGCERVIDVGEVDGRIFLNNVSLGVYGGAVQRPGYRDAKLLTLLETARAVLGPSASAPPIRLVDDQGREHAHPTVLLVSNNPYAPGGRGGRQRLDSGLFGIVIIDAPEGGRPGPGRAWSAATLEVHGIAPIAAGLDGEAVVLSPTVRFAIHPGALRVRIARRHAARITRPGSR